MVIGFGDYDPEDAWDDTDAVSAQVRNLLARLVVLEESEPTDLPARAHRIRRDLIKVHNRIAVAIVTRNFGFIGPLEAIPQLPATPIDRSV